MKNNQMIKNSLAAVNKTVKALEKEDLTILGFYHDSLTKPTIEIEHNPKCSKYIAVGHAVYYRYENCYRFGQFDLNGCRVIWKERNISRLH